MLTNRCIDSRYIVHYHIIFTEPQIIEFILFMLKSSDQVYVMIIEIEIIRRRNIVERIPFVIKSCLIITNRRFIYLTHTIGIGTVYGEVVIRKSGVVVPIIVRNFCHPFVYGFYIHPNGYRSMLYVMTFFAFFVNN